MATYINVIRHPSSFLKLDFAPPVGVSWSSEAITMAKKSTKKNSLVNNINKRKKAGKSRSKSRSTVSKKSYTDMKKGWPKKSRKKASKK